MITIIDYGASNLRSVVNGFEEIGQRVKVTNKALDLEKSSAIVLPGVGAFGDGIRKLRQSNLIPILNDQVLCHQKPFLGICLGLQFLAERSYEYGTHAGLGWIDGVAQKIVTDNPNYRIPHMGWNNITFKNDSLLFKGLENSPTFYFVHSFHFISAAGGSDFITSTCWHGTTIIASIERDNIYAVQFHPEKSQRNGLKVLENFVGLI